MPETSAPDSTILPRVWVAGARVATNGTALSALDRGFTLADGLFETLRVYGGVPFRIDQHLDRLEVGARRLAIVLPPLYELRAMLLGAAAECVAGGALDCALRLTLSRGVGLGGFAPSSGTTPTVVVVASRLPPAVSAAGLTAVVVAGRRNEFAATSGIKTLAYTESVVALLDARAAGADEAILLDTAGHLSEASASNLFIVHGRAVVTPPAECGVLPGITRACVLELCVELGFECEARVAEREELATATELFATSSLREIAPIVRVDGRAVGAGVPGAVTSALQRAFEGLVRRECGEPTCGG